MQLSTIASDMENLTDRDIVIIGLQPWYYEIGSNCKNIANHLAKHNRVLYVNTPINRRTYFAKTKAPGVQKHCSIIKKKTSNIQKVADNLWEYYPSCITESINWLPSTKLFQLGNYYNNLKFATNLKKGIAQLGFEDVIIFNDNDFFNGFHLKKLLKPSLYIYYCRDFLQGFDYWKKHGTVLEPQLIRKADVVVANSAFLADYCSAYNKHAYYIGQGCNLEIFHKDNVFQIEDINQIPNPRIGYVGALDSNRLDKNIIRHIATHHKEWSIVLVGPEDEGFQNSDLHQLSNVYFLGRKQLKELPSYIDAFDICINPQLINNITIGNYPLKIDEYLAMGKPIVATRTKTMEMFQEHVYLASRKEDYCTLIEKAITEDSATKHITRIAFAQSHTWHNSIQKLYKATNNYLLKTTNSISNEQY